MKVLVFGASGFIGFPVAQALVRAGHTVYGVSRSEKKAQQFAAEEIIPIIGQFSDSSKWANLVPTLDAVVDATGGPETQRLSSELLALVSDAAKSTRPAHAPRLTYIYTSGTWVHGDDRTGVKTDTTPLTAPAALVAWRPAQEQQVVTSALLNGIVVRPALLYGRGGSILAHLFTGAAAGKVAWFGGPRDRYALVHADDLAELYVLVAEKAQLVGGKIFDAANDVTESKDDILKRLAEITGVQGPVEYIEPSNPFEVALTTTAYLRPYLARTLLGWRPRKAGLVDNLEIYYNAWKASANL